MVLGAMSAAAYLVCCARNRQTRLTLVDVLIIVGIMAVVTAAATPLFSRAEEGARATTLKYNLRVVRGQIDQYKAEHGGHPPVLFQGTFPQLMAATNAEGQIGPPGEEFPYGPYLRGGLLPNPYTGVSKVQAVDAFPPAATTLVGGWLYHQPTGRIAADENEFLAE